MTTKTIVLIYGLPGSGKTTLARYLQSVLNCQWFNADQVRNTLSRDLGFSAEDRVEQARRLGCLASLSLEHGGNDVCLVDFVNPTTLTFDTFNSNLKRPTGSPALNDDATVPGSFVQASADSPDFRTDFRLYAVYMNTIQASQSRFADTAAMFHANTDARCPNLIVSSFVEKPEDWSSITDHVVKEVVGSEAFPRKVEYSHGKFSK